MAQIISNTEDVLDIRDIIEAVEAHHEIDPMEHTGKIVGAGGGGDVVSDGPAPTEATPMAAS